MYQNKTIKTTSK